MGPLALVTAILGLAAAAVPGVGKFVAVGLGILALGIGLAGWRSPAPRSRPARRIAGAAGMALGLAALTLGGAKIALTLVLLDRLASIG
jgi:hypothetical protein